MALTCETGSAGLFVLWGRGAYSGFDGREDALLLDGTVKKATLGTDYAAGRWLTGLALSHNADAGS